ncbi:MAG TPA: CoA-transferase [Polyangiaceae bacterium]|nr:CoA-transferase [Polyangiaceae bacterium]
MTRLLPLSQAIALHVEPRLHLHFASTPSRSNASIRELARHFNGQRPELVFSATGFHSSAHTLALLGLGRRYIGCFFGDNYPVPRPNALYQKLAGQPGMIEQWSLLEYVLALRAGALGHPYAMTTSAGVSDLHADLERAGQLFEVPDPRGGPQPLRLLAAIVPDITFLHAAVGTASGRALFCPPFGEGFAGALAARRGVIVTVDKLVDERALEDFPELVPLPAANVLAIAEEPFGAHPQPLYAGARVQGLDGYADDFASYEHWREMALRPERFAEYRRRVLEAPDGQKAYFDFVGAAELAALAGSERSEPRLRTVAQSVPSIERTPRELSSADRLVLLAARTIARRVVEGRLGAVLAGIGQGFSAARLAFLLLGRQADSVELLVETGISGFDARDAHPFLLSSANMAGAKRLSSVEENLGLVACGRHNRCLAVVGCAQADAFGNLNSSFVGGKLLVGSGGAADLTAGAREVVVLCRSDRLVPRVEYITSAGERVRAIVTEDAVLERAGVAEAWQLTSRALAEQPASELAAAFPFTVRAHDDAPAFEPTAFELAALAELFAGLEPTARPEPGRAHA